MEEIDKLLNLIQRAERTYESDLDWEDKYDVIFSKSCSQEINLLRKQVGLSFDYYDPDTSYEEDVSAYVRALRDQLKPKLEIMKSIE